MIHIRFNTPLLLLLLLAALAWLVRAPAMPQGRPQPRPMTPRPRRSRARAQTRRRNGGRNGARRDPATVSYAEAIRAPHGTYTESEIAAIAEREVFAAGQESYDRAAGWENPLIVDLPAWKRNQNS